MKRETCTRENPYSKERDTPESRWEHPDADLVDEDYGKGGGVTDGDYYIYICPNCKLRFKVELPN